VDVLATRRPVWSRELAVAVSLVPLVATALLVWAELSSNLGTTPLSFLAGICYFLAPTAGAIAASRTDAAAPTQRIVALIIFAVLGSTWVTFVPQPTHPDVFVGGTGVSSMLVYAVGGALVWYWASRIATRWLQRGSWGVAVAVSGAAVLVGSVAVMAVAVSLPLP
jgi:hypothetical protein